MDFQTLKDLAPTVSVVLILGYVILKVNKQNAETLMSINKENMDNHREKTTTFLSESKSKDSMIMTLIETHLSKSNEVMSKLSESNNKLSAVIEQSLK